MMKTPPVLHPFMLVTLFVLTCYREIQPFVRWEELLGLWFLALLATYGTFRLFKLIAPAPYKASLLTSLVVALGCFYGDADTRLRAVFGLVHESLSRARFVAPVLFGAAFVVAWWVVRTKRDLGVLKKALNVVITVMVLVTVVQERLFPVQFVSRRDRPREVDEHGPFPRVTTRPDIFYIVLDSYTSAESLRKFWNFDNTPFLSTLEAAGFNVVSNARANYDRTYRCMAASLNMALLREPPASLGSFGRVNRACELVDLAAAPRKLEDIGYEIINKSLFDVAGHPQRYKYPFTDFSNLSEVIVQKSFFGYVEAWWRRRQTIDINLKILSELETIATTRSDHPRFIYAHVMMPHAPMAFDRRGRKSNPSFDPHGTPAEYLEQLHYVNERVTNLVAKILTNSATPPIIVLQGDHGFRWLEGGSAGDEALTILNALHVPGLKREAIPEGITPVNTFRLIFNHQFGARYPYAPDRGFLTGEKLSTEPLPK
jgi:hypothetical protein